MALDKKLVTEYIVNKFNVDLMSTHDPKEFILNDIPLRVGYKFAFEAYSTFYDKILRFRMYFNLADTELVSKFVLNSVDDSNPVEEYTFVSRGTINRFAVTTDGTFIDSIPWTGSGVIDPTNWVPPCDTSECGDCMVLMQEDW